MSYAPIYAKLRDLEERLVIVELSPKQHVAVSTMSSSVSDFDNSGLRKEIDDLLNIVSGLVTKAELPDLSAFATKAELPDLSAFATKAELPDLSAFATKAELPDVSSFATEAELPDVSTFATKAELPDVSAFATKAELPDVSAFATKAELPDVSEFVTKAELTDLLTKFDNLINVVSQLNTKLNEANDKISALESA
jgi:hypothetical protein